ncbi:8110_t:CDS:2, partial [Racocetra persica]
MFKRLDESMNKIKARLERLEKQYDEKENDLSAQVIDDVFTCVMKWLFSSHIYSGQNDLKDALRQCLEEKFSEFM